MDFPLGVRFNPKDEEKIDLLLYKATGVSVPSHNFIGTCDLYGEKEPWEIFGQSDESELYLFTTLKKVGKNKKTACEYKRFSRNIGKGTWTNKGKTIPIHRKRKGGAGPIIGYKKCLRYEPKKGDHGDDDTWLLKEYSLADNLQDRVKQEYKDCVLCVLKRKGSFIDSIPTTIVIDVDDDVDASTNINDDVDALWNNIGDDVEFLDMISFDDVGDNVEVAPARNDNNIGDDMEFLEMINFDDVGDIADGSTWNENDDNVGDGEFLDQMINVDADEPWKMGVLNVVDDSWNNLLNSCY